MPNAYNNNPCWTTDITHPLDPIGQTLPRIGFKMSFSEDDPLSFIPKSLDISLLVLLPAQI